VVKSGPVLSLFERSVEKADRQQVKDLQQYLVTKPTTPNMVKK
jgi:hypothetical protein